MFWLLVIAAPIVSLSGKMNWHDCSQYRLPARVESLRSSSSPSPLGSRSRHCYAIKFRKVAKWKVTR